MKFNVTNFHDSPVPTFTKIDKQWRTRNVKQTNENEQNKQKRYMHFHEKNKQKTHTLIPIFSKQIYIFLYSSKYFGICKSINKDSQGVQQSGNHEFGGFGPSHKTTILLDQNWPE